MNFKKYGQREQQNKKLVTYLAPFFGIILTLSLNLTSSALAQHAGPQYINWSVLNLTPDQDFRIGHLEQEWQRIYATIYPRIMQEKEDLRRMLNSPMGEEGQILNLQNRLHDDELKLRNEAIRIFLEKKGQLNTSQKVQLQQMMGN